MKSIKFRFFSSLFPQCFEPFWDVTSNSDIIDFSQLCENLNSLSQSHYLQLSQSEHAARFNSIETNDVTARGNAMQETFTKPKICYFILVSFFF